VAQPNTNAPPRAAPNRIDFFIAELPMTGKMPTHGAWAPLRSHGVVKGDNGLSDMHGGFPIRTTKAYPFSCPAPSIRPK
jgi:hypothetical protein